MSENPRVTAYREMDLVRASALGVVLVLHRSGEIPDYAKKPVAEIVDRYNGVRARLDALDALDKANLSDVPQ